MKSPPGGSLGESLLPGVVGGRHQGLLRPFPPTPQGRLQAEAQDAQGKQSPSAAQTWPQGLGSRKAGTSGLRGPLRRCDSPETVWPPNPRECPLARGKPLHGAAEAAEREPRKRRGPGCRKLNETAPPSWPQELRGEPPARQPRQPWRRRCKRRAAASVLGFAVQGRHGASSGTCFGGNPVLRLWSAASPRGKMLRKEASVAMPSAAIIKLPFLNSASAERCNAIPEMSFGAAGAGDATLSKHIILQTRHSRRPRALCPAWG